MQQKTAIKTNIQIWDDIHRKVQWGDCPEPAVARWAMRRWDGQDKNANELPRILEVGCGVGSQAIWLAQHGFIVDACDASQWAIERAHAAVDGIGINHSVRLYQAELPYLLYPRYGIVPSSYDGVVDVCCLQHVGDLDAALKEIKELLKSGGQLLSIIATHEHSADIGSAMIGATFHRLSKDEMYNHFMPLFSEISIESMTHTDNGRFISHWIVQATK